MTKLHRNLADDTYLPRDVVIHRNIFSVTYVTLYQITYALTGLMINNPEKSNK